MKTATPEKRPQKLKFSLCLTSLQATVIRRIAVEVTVRSRSPASQTFSAAFGALNASPKRSPGASSTRRRSQTRRAVVVVAAAATVGDVVVVAVRR
ncbi:unnamed protein product [Caenorhabditis auriculariae]|uniref:Uncharacterized protein n=1 Tax=Caenorhabditis auriculariae TaxID=2777116 RepID=A0A8S1GTS9_9PELO|nr:unnamed protein product [Caenorhabditis auriculariae]